MMDTEQKGKTKIVLSGEQQSFVLTGCLNTGFIHFEKKRGTPLSISYWKLTGQKEVGCLTSQHRLSQTESDFSREEASGNSPKAFISENFWPLDRGPESTSVFSKKQLEERISPVKFSIIQNVFQRCQSTKDRKIVTQS